MALIYAAAVRRAVERMKAEDPVERSRRLNAIRFAAAMRWQKIAQGQSVALARLSGKRFK